MILKIKRCPILNKFSHLNNGNSCRLAISSLTDTRTNAVDSRATRSKHLLDVIVFLDITELEMLLKV